MDGVRFGLEVERVRVRGLRAIARAADADATMLDERLAQLDRELAEGDSTRGLGYLIGMRTEEVALLWAVVAATVDPELALHLSQLGPRYGRTGMSITQFCSLAELGARGLQLGIEMLGPNPLVRHRLIEPIDPRAVTIETAWAATPRVVAFLAGDDSVDPAIAQAGGIVELPADLVIDDALNNLRVRIAELVAGKPCAIVVQGRRGGGRRTLARAATERPVIAVDLERLRHVALDDALAALAREVLLSAAYPLIAGADDLVGPDATARRRAVARFIEASPLPVFVVAQGALPQLEISRPTFRFEVPLPPPRTRVALWRRELGPAAEWLEDDIGRVAQRFQLTPGAIRDAVIAARATAAARQAPVDEGDLVEGVGSTVEERLGGLARRHATELSWDDVVLASDVREQVEQLVARIRNAYQVLERWGFQRHLPGSGVAALFSGPPGTGKTMLAAVMARALGLELYRVDLAQITSKWIGETEKQLDRVFDAAETGHAMLLFDEADSLFAKRTEVKGATERYANMEVNFLLQRVETFAGVAILTTNMDGSLDPAFRRRLAAHIRFPHPDHAERRELWRRLIPRSAPVSRDLDFERLAADFPAFAGAQIRNALTTAAFLAANAGRPIDQALLRRAASDETYAMGRIVTASHG